MGSILKISEAASIALHTMYYLSVNEDRLISTKEIAIVFCVSENHLAKVMQRLVKVGLVSSIRGPKGGFKLGRDKNGITLLEIYETIDGAIELGDCLFSSRACDGENCILGELVKNINKQVRDTFAQKKLSEFTKGCVNLLIS